MPLDDRDYISTITGTDDDDVLFGNNDNNIISSKKGTDVSIGMNGDDLFLDTDHMSDFFWGGEGMIQFLLQVLKVISPSIYRNIGQMQVTILKMLKTSLGQTLMIN